MGESMKGRVFALCIALLMLVTLVGCNSEADQVKCIDIPLTNEHYAFGVNKNDIELLNAANELLSELKANGELDKIINKYFSNDTSSIKTFDCGKESRSKNQLVVATHIPFSPFEYKIGDRYCGIDIEIAGLLAEKLDAELLIKEIDFNNILDAVANGEADIVMAGLSVSTDREKLVSFTDTYFEASQVIIARQSDKTFNDCKTTEDVVEILKKMTKNTKIGYQSDTISQAYINGDDSLDFTGYNVTSQNYDSALQAAKALVNGEIDYVIVDAGPARIIVDTINKKN